MSVTHTGLRQLFRAHMVLEKGSRAFSTGLAGVWTCRACQQVRPLSSLGSTDRKSLLSIGATKRRCLSVSAFRRAEGTQTDAHSAQVTTTTPTADPKELPSHSQSRRSDLTKRFHSFMDDMLAKATVAGQQLNVYTGTDYSGIETLRQQIIEQERGLKSRHAKVAAARDTYAAAHAEQGASQKEVVSLLERKSSWSPSDLDRYTSLIRSEHLHEQSVNAARQALAAAEKELEEARTELEHKERKKYHEEQIWSDTIRRNSTWVTFGLMGLNILLLIANIGIFEPWRRRRLVREVKAALDEKTVTAKTSPAEPVEVPVATLSVIETSKAADEVTEALPAQSQAPAVADAPGVEVKPEEAAVVIESEPEPVVPTQPRTVQSTIEEINVLASSVWKRTREVYREWSIAPLGEGRLSLTQVEVTSLAVQSVVVGMAVMGCLTSMLRSR